jgi:hypothetical protein
VLSVELQVVVLFFFFFFLVACCVVVVVVVVVAVVEVQCTILLFCSRFKILMVESRK